MLPLHPLLGYPLLQITFFSISALVALCTVAATELETIDNGDERVHYYGPWTFNHSDDDPQGLNWQGTVSYGDIPDADAVVYFSGTSITVYGAFYPEGTYDMKSSYSIDDGPATTFVPDPTISQSKYRQKFFQSNTLSDGDHTLTITNLGRQFWFDFVQVTVDSPVADSEPVTSTPSQPPEHAVSSSTTTSKPPPSSMSSSHTPSASSAPSKSSTSSSSSVHSSASTLSSSSSSANISTTSSTASSAVSSPIGFGSVTVTDVVSTTATTSIAATSTSSGIVAGGIFSGSSTHGFPIGAIAGIAVGGTILLIALLVIVCWIRKRSKLGRRNTVEPFDATSAPSPESISFPFDREKFVLSATHSREALLPRSGQPSPSEEHRDMLQTHTSDARTSPVDGPSRQVDERPVLRSGTTRSKHSVRSPGSMLSPVDTRPAAHTAPPPLPSQPRQSMDGGVRLAGGPPGRVATPMTEDRTSVFSTMPPAYQYYP